jgi:hypothetical protein
MEWLVWWSHTTRSEKHDPTGVCWTDMRTQTKRTRGIENRGTENPDAFILQLNTECDWIRLNMRIVRVAHFSFITQVERQLCIVNRGYAIVTKQQWGDQTNKFRSTPMDKPHMQTLCRQGTSIEGLIFGLLFTTQPRIIPPILHSYSMGHLPINTHPLSTGRKSSNASSSIPHLSFQVPHCGRQPVTMPIMDFVLHTKLGPEGKHNWSCNAGPKANFQGTWNCWGFCYADHFCCLQPTIMEAPRWLLLYCRSRYLVRVLQQNWPSKWPTFSSPSVDMCGTSLLMP